jgi:hypothetical protein
MTAALTQLASAVPATGSSGVTAAFWVALIALAVSLSTLATGWFRDRRLLLLRIHESLTTTDQQKARREIHRLADEGHELGKLEGDDRAEVNHALAALNTMAIYYDRNWVSRNALLQFWAEPVLNLMPKAQQFLDMRKAEHRRSGGRIWQELDLFARDARDYGTERGWDPTGPNSRDDDPAAVPARLSRGRLALRAALRATRRRRVR